MWLEISVNLPVSYFNLFTTNLFHSFSNENIMFEPLICYTIIATAYTSCLFILVFITVIIPQLTAYVGGQWTYL